MRDSQNNNNYMVKNILEKMWYYNEDVSGAGSSGIGIIN